MNKIYYSQVDSRWANYPYPSQALPNATIGSGGCGVASAAMIVSMLKQIVTPIEIADLFIKDGIRVNGGTSNAAFDSYLTNKYGLKQEKKWKIAEAKECLEKGGLVVARCLGSKGKLFTTTGHFIVLAGFKNNEFEVYDPYLYNNKFNTSYRAGKARIEGTSVFVSYENMKEYGGYNELWCYEPTGIDTNKDTNIPDTKQPETNTFSSYKAKVIAKSGLNARAGAGTNYAIKSGYGYGKEITIVEESNGWGKTTDGYWVCLSYVSKINNTSASTSYKIMTVIAKSGLNVRSAPNTSSKIVTAYAYKTKVKVYSISNGWAKGTKGYMYAKYLK